MKKFRRIAALLLVLAFAAGLAACATDPSGTYTAVRIVKSGVEAGAEELAQSGVQISISFHADGTGVLRFNAESEPFTWLGNLMTSQDGDTIEFRFDGETLTLEREDTRMEFRK